MAKTGRKQTAPGEYTEAEKVVIKWLLHGLSNKEIAEKLYICEKTCKFHLTNIYKKAGVKKDREFITKYFWRYKPDRLDLTNI